MPMSGRFTKVIAAVMSAMLLASCSDWPSGLKPAETYETPETTAVVTEAPATPTPIPTPTEKPVPKFPEFEPDYKSAAPALGYKTRSLTFFRDGNPITGRITYPEGEGPFKTIIISNGLYAGFGRYAAFAQRFSTYGYAVIEYQYQNGTAPSPYHDPDWLGDFIYEQVLDLYAVLDGAKMIPRHVLCRNDASDRDKGSAPFRPQLLCLQDHEVREREDYQNGYLSAYLQMLYSGCHNIGYQGFCVRPCQAVRSGKGLAPIQRILRYRWRHPHLQGRVR